MAPRPTGSDCNWSNIFKESMLVRVREDSRAHFKCYVCIWLHQQDNHNCGDGAIGKTARPGQSSLSAGALRYRAWAQSWSSTALAARSVLPWSWWDGCLECETNKHESIVLWLVCCLMYTRASIVSQSLTFVCSKTITQCLLWTRHCVSCLGYNDKYT